jgi:hypothetical protein
MVPLAVVVCVRWIVLAGKNRSFLANPYYGGANERVVDPRDIVVEADDW